jgi:hypothetical protein
MFSGFRLSAAPDITIARSQALDFAVARGVWRALLLTGAIFAQLWR